MLKNIKLYEIFSKNLYKYPKSVQYYCKSKKKGV